MKKYLTIILVVCVAFGRKDNQSNDLVVDFVEPIMQYNSEEQLLVCLDGEVDLGWGDCNSLTGNSDVPNGCMPTGCFSVEETIELNFSYINLGEFPENIGELTNLNYINISDCGITGSLPESIRNLNKLISIQVYDNNHSLTDSLDTIDSELSGSIPLALGSIESLKYIRLDNNDLTGEIPSEIGGMDSLMSLILNGNQFNGEIPSSLMDSPNLVSLSLSNNQFSGQIPLDIIDLVNLETIDISNNLLTGYIPPGMANLSDLYFVNVSGNKLTGSIDEQFCSMYFTDFSENRFCGPYAQCLSPEELGAQDTSRCADLYSFDQNYYPKTFKIIQAYPNPFNPNITIDYNLKEDSKLSLNVYNQLGKHVKTLFDEYQSKGSRSIKWDATNQRNESVSGGLYIFTMQAGKFRQTKKIVLVK